MRSLPEAPTTTAGRVVAVLGPTNTGKTHFAVERLLAHKSGMMGFPLRLLAREIYDRIVVAAGPAAVTLVTGEERLGSLDARFLICTVEAMPQDREVAFLAIDEIQLCADPERGHVFTDRLLNARGYEETMFLGADTVRPVLRRLVPEAEIVTRPRFSRLTHIGDIKLTRLPRRSAVVAFTAAEVYAVAEVIRRQKGGAAVVLGALSPRTRNAQVAMYQAGEVDHLVATDAIGMGLNMDVTHVAFAALRKFDGHETRRLLPPEIGQIAGRAGRHMRDGTFGTTGTCEELDPKEIEAVEGHGFAPLKSLRWRNAALDFSSLEALGRSLDLAPPADCLIKVRDALDDRSLALLARRPEIRARAACPERVRLLWQVCQIPDFRKTLTDAHLHLLATVFDHLTSGRGTLPRHWVGAMIARLERTEGDIDTLVTRLAHIRTWTYMAHRADWLDDAKAWQERAREVEDKLSDALHDRLTQRFVDRRATALVRSLRENGEQAAIVAEGGEVVVDEHRVGRLDGLVFTLEPLDLDAECRLLLATARRAVRPALLRRAQALLAAPAGELAIDEADRIVWRGAVVGSWRAGAGLTSPRVEVMVDATLDSAVTAGVQRRLEAWTGAWIALRVAPLQALEAATADGSLGGAARGIAYRLVEGLGCLEREDAREQVTALGADDRTRLTRLGVRFGWHFLYLPALLKPAAVGARARLLRVFDGRQDPLPPVGRTVLRGADTPASPTLARALGYLWCGTFALRVDVLERLAAQVRGLARLASPFTVPAELAHEAGLNRGELALLVEALGFRLEGAGHELVFARPRQRDKRRRPTAAETPRRAALASTSPFAVLARLKVHS